MISKEELSNIEVENNTKYPNKEYLLIKRLIEEIKELKVVAQRYNDSLGLASQINGNSYNNGPY